MKKRALLVGLGMVVVAVAVVILLKSSQPEGNSRLSGKSEVATKSSYELKKSSRMLLKGDFEGSIRLDLESENYHLVGAKFLDWVKSDPEKALEFYIENICEPSLAKSKFVENIDVYFLLKEMVLALGEFDFEKSQQILSLSSDVDVQSAMMWGMAENLVADGDGELAKKIFSSLSVESQDAAGNNFIVVLAGSDPEDAAAFIVSQGLRGESIGALLQIWAKTDWRKAISWATKRYGEDLEYEAVSRLTSTIARLSFEEIDAFTSEYGGPVVDSLKPRIAEIRMDIDLKSGAEWGFKNLNQDEFGELLSKRLLLEIADTDLVLELIPMLAGEARSKVEYELGRSYFSGVEKDEALEWAELLKADGFSSGLLNGVVSAWAEVDLDAAFEFVNNSESLEMQDGLILSVTRSMVKAEQVDEEYVDWLVSTNLEGESLGVAVSQMLIADAAYASDLISRSGAVEQTLARGVSSALAKKSPEKAIEWAQGLGEEIREWAVADALAVWSSADAEAALDWLYENQEIPYIEESLWVAIANVSPEAPAEVRKGYALYFIDSKRRGQAMTILGLD